MWLDNKKLGRVTWGLWSEAKDDITKDNVVIKGLDQTMHADFYMNWSFFLRPKGSQFQNAEGLASVRYLDIGRCYSTANSAFDCSTRRMESRYDTPEWYGFIGSVSLVPSRSAVPYLTHLAPMTISSSFSPPPLRRILGCLITSCRSSQKKPA